VYLPVEDNSFFGYEPRACNGTYDDGGGENNHFFAGVDSPAHNSSYHNGGCLNGTVRAACAADKNLAHGLYGTGKISVNAQEAAYRYIAVKKTAFPDKGIDKIVSPRA
jgi:hypothetical protein